MIRARGRLRRADTQRPPRPRRATGETDPPSGGMKEGARMKRLRRLGLGLAAAGLLAAMPGSVLADSASHSYIPRADEANVCVAASGETIHVTCEATGGESGTFSVNPKSIEASGEFDHFLPDGS